MVITSYTFLYPFGYHCNRLCNSTATSLTVVLQPLCSMLQHLCSILYLMSFDKYLISFFQSSSEKIDSSSIRNFSSLT